MEIDRCEIQKRMTRMCDDVILFWGKLHFIYTQYGSHLKISAKYLMMLQIMYARGGKGVAVV